MSLAVALVSVSTASVAALVRHSGPPPGPTSGTLAATPPASTLPSSAPASSTPAAGHRPGATPGRAPAAHLGQLPDAQPMRTTPATVPASGAPLPPSGSTCRLQVWTHLAACGWPGPGNTGRPPSAAFSRVVAGGYVANQDGMVIDSWKVTGGIQVRARNVVIRNSLVSNNAGGANGSGVININPGASATVEHNTLDGGNATHACLWHEGSQLTARFNDCQRINDGVFSWATQTGVNGTGDNFTIESNYFHAFTTQAANGHIDGYQTEGARNGVIRHNTFDISQDQNSAVAVWNSRKSSDNILVDHNLMAGGGFTVYAEDYSPSEQSPAGGYTVTRIRFTGNVFSTVHFGCVGSYGVWFPRGRPTDAWSRTGNVVLETGQRVDAGNPTYHGTPCT